MIIAVTNLHEIPKSCDWCKFARFNDNGYRRCFIAEKNCPYRIIDEYGPDGYDPYVEYGKLEDCPLREE